MSHAREILAGGMVALAAMSGGAAAHPHVFSDTRIGFLRNESGDVTALRVRWHYDAFTSLTLWDILELDPDRDGVLDAADFAKVAEGETDWFEGYTGDMHLSDGPGFGRPFDAEAGEEDARIWVEFTLPFEAPRDAGALMVEVYDPTYYYAYTVEADAPEGCFAEVLRPDLDGAAEDLRLSLAALSREEMPENPNVGAAFAETVVLSCD